MLQVPRPADSLTAQGDSHKAKGKNGAQTMKPPLENIFIAEIQLVLSLEFWLTAAAYDNSLENKLKIASLCFTKLFKTQEV